jgi:hypothetical protein
MSKQPQGLKDKALQTYYEALFAMYPTAGWRVLLEDLGRLREIYDRATTIETERELYTRHGQIDMIDQLLTHAQRSEHGYNAALEDESGEEQENTGGAAKIVDPEPQ